MDCDLDVITDGSLNDESYARRWQSFRCLPSAAQRHGAVSVRGLGRWERREADHVLWRWAMALQSSVFGQSGLGGDVDVAKETFMPLWSLGVAVA